MAEEHIISSTNKKDKCVTINVKDLENPFCRLCDFMPQLEADIDNDGFIESLLLLEQGEGFSIDASKRSNDGVGLAGDFFEYQWDDMQSSSQAINNVISIMLHDFDNDGANEIIVAWTDGGISGRVFKLNGSKTDPAKASGLKNWFEEVGAFVAWDRLNIDGQFVHTQVSPIGGVNYTYIYLNGKLRKIE